MKCPECQGPHGQAWTTYSYCPTCGGTGFIHCCEGLCEQPEEEEYGTVRTEDADKKVALWPSN